MAAVVVRAGVMAAAEAGGEAMAAAVEEGVTAAADGEV